MTRRGSSKCQVRCGGACGGRRGRRRATTRPIIDRIDIGRLPLIESSIKALGARQPRGGPMRGGREPGPAAHWSDTLLIAPPHSIHDSINLNYSCVGTTPSGRAQSRLIAH